MLETRNLGVGYGNLQVVHDVSLSIGQGEIVALVGGNGAGKTTTLRAIVGLLPPWQGEVRLDGKPIQNLKTPQIVALGLAYVPEQKSVFPKMTVMENLELALNSKEAKQKKQETMAEVFDLFPRLSILQAAPRRQVARRRPLHRPRRPLHLPGDGGSQDPHRLRRQLPPGEKG